MKRLLLGCLALFLSMASVAFGDGSGLTIKTSLPLYKDLPAVQDVTIASDYEIRQAADTAVAGAYRARVPDGLPAGKTFKIVYLDGSSESVVITNPLSSLGATPIPGSQKSAGSSGSSGGSGGSGGGGGTGSTGGGSSGGSGGGGGPVSVDDGSGDHGWACTSIGSGDAQVWHCTRY
jgi:uncharacterized membrane protein YgcG